uniref:Uncharacterized protein n=1 Tax=Oryza brachyantha TaxID=4533 RepID=J3L2X8_ORYBR
MIGHHQGPTSPFLTKKKNNTTQVSHARTGLETEKYNCHMHVYTPRGPEAKHQGTPRQKRSSSSEPQQLQATERGTQRRIEPASRLHRNARNRDDITKS